MAGFVCREITAEDNNSDDHASVIQGLLYSAAPTFTLALYTFLTLSVVTPKLLPWLNQNVSYFVILAFNTAVITCTAQGCSVYFNPDASQSSISSALALLKASLLLQLVQNAAFVLITIIAFTSRHKERFNTDVIAGARGPRAASFLMLSSFALMTLICIRNVFRTVQIFAAPSSQVWTEEAYFWVFEACAMLLFTVLFHILHPAKYLPLV